MKKVLKILLLFCIMVKSYSQIQSSRQQTSPVYFSTSPNASTLGSYGLVPVNLSTGSPNINISLLKFTTKGTDYNIALSYNLNSVKPEAPAAWTGLGWNLNVGGAVTRSVNGYADETRGPGLTRESYYDYFYKFDDNDWFNSPKYDSPDMFLFEINGINGKFYKNHKGKWIVSANQEINFSVTDEIRDNYFTYQYGNYIYPKKERCIYGFEIVDKYGNSYTFGKNENSLEISEPELNSSNYFAETDPVSPFYSGKFVKSWYLTKIKYANGTIINFEYESDNNITLIQHYSINYGFNTQCINTFGCGYSMSYERMHLKYLKKINFDEGAIVFNRSLANVLKYNIIPAFNSFLANYNNTQHWYKLDSIVLYDKNNTIINNIEFSYEENINSRLKLNKLKLEKDNIKEYIFTYNSNKLPSIQYNNSDHWGFYNNKNFTLTSLTRTDAENYYNFREPDSIAVRAETLERIDYPTGGFNIIEYESNLYSKQVESQNNQINILDNNLNKIAGGLRVKKIKTYASESSIPTTKTYYYIRDYFKGQKLSSGVLSGTPKYFYEDHFDNGSGEFDFWNWSSNSYIPLNETAGYHIGYSKVYEKHENGSLTEYSYSNYDNGYNDIVPIYPSKRTDSHSSLSPLGQNSVGSKTHLLNNNIILNSISQERGLLLSKKDYDINNKLLSETLTTYNNNSNRLTDEIRNFKFDFLFKKIALPMGPGYIDSYISKWTPYIIYSNAVQKISEKTIEYFNSGNIESNTIYTFSNSFSSSPKKITTNLNDGTILEKQFSYANDLRHGSLPNHNIPPYGFLSEMGTSNMIGIPIVTTAYKNNFFQNRNQIIYERDLTNGLLLPKKKLYYSEDKTKTVIGNIILPDTNFASTELIYDLYDSKGNLLQYTQKDGVSTTIIWGYSQTQPIAKIEGAKLTDIPQSLITNIITASDNDNIPPQGVSAEQAELNLLSTLDSFRTQSALSGYQITTYTYDTLIGVRSITPPSGIREVYLYDSANRLEKIVDANGKVLKEYQYHYKN